MIRGAHAGEIIGRAVDFEVSAFPPSFDNNPIVFALALFARLLVMLLAAATLVRIYSKNRTERLPGNHPVYYHRAVTCAFLWAALVGSTSDVLVYLCWGEISNGATAIVLLVSQIMNGVTFIPLLAALFPTIWLGWLCRIGFIHTSPTIILNGIVSDVRATWDSKTVPLRLLIYSAISAAVVTGLKYLLWIEHARS